MVVFFKNRMSSPTPLLWFQSNCDSIWVFADEYGCFQLSYSYFYLESDWLQVVSGGSGWFWGIADILGGQFCVLADDFGLFAALVATKFISEQKQFLYLPDENSCGVNKILSSKPFLIPLFKKNDADKLFLVSSQLYLIFFSGKVVSYVKKDIYCK